MQVTAQFLYTQVASLPRHIYQQRPRSHGIRLPPAGTKSFGEKSILMPDPIS
jgi:hypothetical protein